MPKLNLDLELAGRGARVIESRSAMESNLDAPHVITLEREDAEAIEAFIAVAMAQDSLDDDTYESIFGDNDSIEIALDAIESLARANAMDSIPVILCFLNWLEDEDESDLMVDQGPSIVASFQPSAAYEWLKLVLEVGGNESVKSAVIDGIMSLGERDTTIREELAPLIIDALGSARKHTPLVNAQLMTLATDWHITEAAEVIERAFADNLIDCGINGDWQEVRKMLHVEGIGLTMPKNPVNSMVDFRRKVGIGAFSKEIIFMRGELQEDAAHDYLETACRAFSQSPQGRQFSCNVETRGYVWQFLELGIQYLGVTVENMTVSDAGELMLEIIPRKVSMDADDADEAIDELVAFWEFCERVHQIADANAIKNRIQKLRNDFREALDDSSKFGMAKSFLMAGKRAGFDMTTQQGLSEFMVAYNSSITSNNAFSTPPSTARYESRVDPAESPSAVAGMSLKQRKKLLAMRKQKRK